LYFHHFYCSCLLPPLLSLCPPIVGWCSLWSEDFQILFCFALFFVLFSPFKKKSYCCIWATLWHWPKLLHCIIVKFTPPSFSIILTKLLRLALKLNSSCLSLPSSWDSRDMSPHLALDNIPYLLFQ
jgi:hypothetical protein